MKISIDDIRAAAERIEGRVVKTPLIESAELNSLAGRRVFMKAENLQRGGAFKCRGAFNKILKIPESVRKAGVIAHSSGNHAVAVSLVAADLGIPAVVVMPSDAPDIKVALCRRYGAEIIFFDRATADRQAICEELINRRELNMILPFDDVDIIAGAGTTALEAINQLPDGSNVDALLACCSGGGLTSGWAVTATTLMPHASVFAVEPECFDDVGRSLLEGRRLHNSAVTGSICDCLLAPTPGVITFEVMSQANVRGLVVSDDQVVAAVRFGFEHLKMVVEPGGAVALAAILNHKLPSSTGNVLLTLSGGNMDANRFLEIAS
jgi:threonine dehydratase